MRATCEPWNSAVRYGPGSRPLCGAEGRFAIHTQDPALATGCADCLELAVEALGGNNRCAGHCRHREQEISAQGGVAWRRAVRQPCPHAGDQGGKHTRKWRWPAPAAGKHPRGRPIPGGSFLFSFPLSRMPLRAGAIAAGEGHTMDHSR